MSSDDLLIALIIIGFGLSGAYFRAEYLSWRRGQASERKRERSLRELHARRLSCEEMTHPHQASTGWQESSMQKS